MIPSYVHGSIAPTFTAFQEDGRIDEQGQRQLLDFMVSRGGISAFFVRSGMGQMYAYTYDDVKLMAELACKHLRGVAPVLVGTTGIWDRNLEKRPDPATHTRQAVELSRFAESVGAAGVVNTLPDAIVPTNGETPGDVTLRHFEAVSKAVNIPVFIYQPPGTAKEYIVSVEIAAKLADMPNVMGMKASTADATFILNTCWAVAGKDFAYIVGNETAFLAGLAAGARAVIGQGATINPKILNAIQDRYAAGDVRGALDAQRSTNLLVEESDNGVEFFKRYATEKGYNVPPHNRSMDSNPYKKPSKSALTREAYESYKQLLESELAKYLA